MLDATTPRYLVSRGRASPYSRRRIPRSSLQTRMPGSRRPLTQEALCRPASYSAPSNLERRFGDRPGLWWNRLRFRDHLAEPSRPQLSTQPNSRHTCWANGIRLLLQAAPAARAKSSRLLSARGSAQCWSNMLQTCRNDHAVVKCEFSAGQVAGVVADAWQVSSGSDGAFEAGIANRATLLGLKRLGGLA